MVKNFFFFKQKTAYEISACLVGSEMCIRDSEISAKQAQEILREAPGVMLVDKREDGGYVTPVEAVGEYATYVSRVRDDPTVDNGLSLWIVSDNLRKGAALNAVQILSLIHISEPTRQAE